MALANMALVEQHQRYISGHLEILNLLVGIISRASNEDIVVKSCWLCANIALSASARSHLMNAGIIPPLVRFLGQSKTLSTAAEVLSALRNLLCDGTSLSIAILHRLPFSIDCHSPSIAFDVVCWWHRWRCGVVNPIAV